MRNNHSFSFKPWTPSVLRYLSLGLFLLCLAHSSPARAIDQTSQLFQQTTQGAVSSQPMALPETTASPSPGIFSTFLRLLIALGLVVGLIFVTVWGLKLIWEKRGLNNPADDTKPVKILTSTYLAPRKAIYLVEVGSRILVLGVGNDEVNRLDVITDPDEIEMIRHSSQAGFPNILNRLLQREVIEKSDEETERMIIESNETVGGYVEKLKQAGKKKKDDPSQGGQA